MANMIERGATVAIDKRDDLESRVEATLARFSKAVKESSTRAIDMTVSSETAYRTSPRDGAERSLEEEPLRTETISAKPSCRPWNYDDFTARLRTFTPFNWFAKPSAASPLMCARYGWINAARDTLACQSCTSRIVCTKEDQRDPSFWSRLESAHHILCPWNANACPAEFLQLPSAAREDLRAEFRTRLENLAPNAAASDLPEVAFPDDFQNHCPGGIANLAANVRTLLLGSNDAHGAAEDEERRSLRKQDRQQASQAAENGEGSVGRQPCDGAAAAAGGGLAGLGDEVLGVVAALAVFGWRAVVVESNSSEKTGIARGAEDGEDRRKAQQQQQQRRLCCSLCNRRVAVDNFLAIDANAVTNTALGPGTRSEDQPSPGRSPEKSSTGGDGWSQKRRRLSGGGTPLKAMHLAAEHRPFCPWAVVHPVARGETQDPTVAVPGWRQTLEAVLVQEEEQPAEAPARRVDDDTDDATSKKATEALDKVQRVLDVLMSC